MKLELEGKRAAFTVFVASGPASAVNGAALRVDGGVVRAIV